MNYTLLMAILKYVFLNFINMTENVYNITLE